MISHHYMPGEHTRARWMRVNTAEILKRLFFCERSLVISQAGWLPALAPLAVKTTVPRLLWEDTLTAHALRERVHELRYPNRLLEAGEDAPLLAVFDQARHAPSAAAFILGLARVLKPSLLAAYEDYLNAADELAEAPSLRFLRLAAAEQAQHVAVLTRFAEGMLREAPEQTPAAEAWASALSQHMLAVGGLSLDKPRTGGAAAPAPGQRPFALAETPARDAHYHLCRFYWPDTIDPKFPYGEGVALQLRSAVSHLNEVWAVETGGAILHAFADDLPWEFIHDAARWTYDEARHARMGYTRLRAWGFEPQELPLGSYLYDSAHGEDPIIRLAMLHYFETKNIGKKTQRAETFAAYHDRLSQHDMEFDWADETIHAHYGQRWHSALRARYPDRIPAKPELHARCEQLVAAQIASATEAERLDIQQVAAALIAKGERVGLAGG